MRRLTVAFWCMPVSAAAFGQVLDSSDNTCRQGLFTSESDEFSLGVLKKRAKATRRAYFYDGSSDKCPESASSTSFF